MQILKILMTSKILAALVAATLLAVVGADPAYAQAPKLDYLFPAGAQRGTSEDVTAAGTFKSWPVQVWTSDANVKFVPDKKRGRFKVTVGKSTLPGVCWIRLFDKYGGSNLRPFIVDTLPQVSEKETNDDLSTPHYLNENQVTVNGRLARNGDVDVYSIDLKKGQTFVASMEAHHRLRSPMDGVLQIVSPDGFVLAQNDDYHGYDPQIVFSVPADGRYAVRAFAFPATPTSSIRFAGAATFVYRLTLTTGGFVDHAIPLSVSKSSPEKVKLVGWNIPPAMSNVPVISTPDSIMGIAFHPNLGGFAPIRLEPHAVAVAPQSLTIPMTATGSIATRGEQDVYEFKGKKGQRLSIDIDAAAIGSPLDPVLRVRDQAGKTLKQIQSKKIGLDPALSFTVPANAVYHISIRDLHGRGGERYVYRLRLTKQEPDFALKVAKDRFVLAPGKTLEIPIAIDRKNGFKAPIDIIAEGLLNGITAVPLLANAKAKTVKLRLTGKGGVAFGAFRILGQAKNSRKLRRIARTPLADFDTVTMDLWITMSPEAKSPKKSKKN